jgi:hypothetical protein
MGIINFFRWLLKPSINRDQIYIIDDISGEKFSLLDYIISLEDRIEKLEHENIETTNSLYEIMNTLDKFNDSEYDVRKFTSGE